MSVFDNKHILGNASLKSCFHQLFEEWNELAEFSDLGKLMLEIHPDVVRVHTDRLVFLQQNNILHVLVEVFLELSKLGALEVSFGNIFMLWINLEQLFSVVEIHSVVIGEFEISINWVGSSGVNVMNCSLWHQVQRSKKL